MVVAAGNQGAEVEGGVVRTAITDDDGGEAFDEEDFTGKRGFVETVEPLGAWGGLELDEIFVAAGRDDAGVLLGVEEELLGAEGESFLKGVEPDGGR
jgi:hypothetical protein